MVNHTHAPHQSRAKSAQNSLTAPEKKMFQSPSFEVKKQTTERSLEQPDLKASFVTGRAIRPFLEAYTDKGQGRLKEGNGREECWGYQ